MAASPCHLEFCDYRPVAKKRVKKKAQYAFSLKGGADWWTKQQPYLANI
jgi:hypothetical protein